MRTTTSGREPVSAAVVTAAGPPRRPASRAAQPVPLVAAATFSLVATAVLLTGCLLNIVVLLVTVGLLQLALVLSWVRTTDLPGPAGATALGLLTAAAADAAAARWYEHGYESALAVLGLSIAAMFVHQLLRGNTRIRLVQSLSGTAVLLVAVCSVTGLLLVHRAGYGARESAAIAAATGVALLVSNIVDEVVARPRLDPSVDRGLLAVLLGTGAASLLAVRVLHATSELSPMRAATVGAAVGAVSCLLSVGASFAAVDDSYEAAAAGGDRAGDPGPRPGWYRLRALALVLLVMCLATPVGYVAISALAR